MTSSALALLALSLVADRPLAELPYTPGLDPAAMDRAVDFSAFACGGWRRKNPIPADQASWGVYAKTAQENQQFLWGILEAAARPGAARSAEERLVGDFFAACMDERGVEQAGAAPLAADLAAIDGLGSRPEMARLVARLHLDVDAGMLFGFGSEQSYERSEEVVAWVTAGGLGLPDRDFYVKDDARSRDVRASYRALVERMLRLSGLGAKRARAGAEAVLRIETSLARASLSAPERRDPRRLWNRTPVAELTRTAPGFGWGEYLAASGAPSVEWVNVTEPAFVAELDRQLAREPLDAWKAYLRWHLVRSRASSLSAPFQQAHFAFYGTKLRGAKELPPRWKRCVRVTDALLGEAL